MTVLTLQVHATAVELSAAAVARQVWHGDELEPDQVELMNRQRGCGLYACSSTGRYGGRRLCCLLMTNSLVLMCLA